MLAYQCVARVAGEMDEYKKKQNGEGECTARGNAGFILRRDRIHQPLCGVRGRAGFMLPRDRIHQPPCGVRGSFCPRAFSLRGLPPLRLKAQARDVYPVPGQDVAGRRQV